MDGSHTEPEGTSAPRPSAVPPTRFFATPLNKQSSGQLTSMVGANALLVVSEETRALAAGDEVLALLVAEWGDEVLAGASATPGGGAPDCC